MKHEHSNLSKEEIEDLINDACGKGAVLALFYFDAHAKNEETVKTSLVDFMDRISKEKGVLYCTGEIEPALEKDGMYSSATETRILADRFETLVILALKYGPIALEIIKPTSIKINADEMQGILVDASQITQEFTEYILKNTLKGDSKEEFDKRLSARIELGKKIVEKQSK
ncbi:MAG: hypothetical protein ABH803_03850 [Candidatus Micrarchaeota archaeon]